MVRRFGSPLDDQDHGLLIDVGEKSPDEPASCELRMLVLNPPGADQGLRRVADRTWDRAASETHALLLEAAGEESALPKLNL